MRGFVPRPITNEHALHTAVARYLSAALREPSWWSTFPAGGGGKARGQRLKAAGMKAGVPDVLVMTPRLSGGTQVLGIELKTTVGRVSKVQQETHAALVLANVRCRVARSIEDVQRILEIEGVPLHAWCWGNGIRRAA